MASDAIRLLSNAACRNSRRSSRSSGSRARKLVMRPTHLGRGESLLRPCWKGLPDAHSTLTTGGSSTAGESAWLSGSSLYDRTVIRGRCPRCKLGEPLCLPLSSTTILTARYPDSIESPRGVRGDGYALVNRGLFLASMPAGSRRYLERGNKMSESRMLRRKT